MSCPGVRLDAYLDGELSPAGKREVEAHVDGCAGCASELRKLSSASAAVKAWEPRGPRAGRGGLAAA
ncbi:MAG: anti-sigma factor family protein, partial [Planctomycetota bacterium]